MFESKKKSINQMLRNDEHSKNKSKSSDEPLLHIDLYNFDDPTLEGSKYVLTSPRSLEACSNLGIKPVQLLPVNFEEFRTAQGNVPEYKLLSLYAEVEASRKNNLEQARLERERLIRLEHRVFPTDVSSLATGVLGKGYDLSTGKCKVSEERNKGPNEPPVANGKPVRPSRFPHRRPASGADFTKTSKSATLSSLKKSRPRSSSSENSLSVSRHYPIATPQMMRSALNFSCSSLDKDKRSTQSGPKVHEKILQMDREYARPRHRAKSRDSASERIERLWSPSQWEKEIEMSRTRRNHALENSRRELKLLEEKYKRDLEEEAVLREKEKALEEKDEKHRKLYQDERKKLAEKLEQQRHQMLQKKRRIGDNLRKQSEEMQHYHVELRQHAEESLRRAEQDKLRQEMLEQERRKIESRLKEEEFWRRKLRLDVERNLLQEDLRRSMRDRDTRVSRNQKKINDTKEASLQQAQLERMRKFAKTTERRKILDSEIKEYQQELLRYQDAVLKRAEAKVSEKLSQEQKRVHDERTMKDRVQQNNYQHLQALEQEWKEDAENLLRFKEEKAKKLHSELQARVEESRALANAAELLREEIRKAYKLDTFDKKVQQVNMMNHFGFGQA